MRILKLFTQLRDVIVLAICILLSFLLLVFNNFDPGSPFRKVAFSTIGEIGTLIYDVGAYFRLNKKVSELRSKNVELSLQNMQLKDALLENIRLRQLLEFKNESQLQLIAAEVIGKNPSPVLNSIVLNVGKSNGIAKSDAVLIADGLVGSIIHVEENKSICQILFDRNSRISAKIQRNRELGIVAWDGGNYLKMLYIAKTIKVSVGDVITTSGYSQIFPENIKIGVVIDVSLETEGLFQEIVVKPAVNFNRLEEVFIFGGKKDNVG